MFMLDNTFEYDQLTPCQSVSDGMKNVKSRKESDRLLP